MERGRRRGRLPCEHQRQRQAVVDPHPVRRDRNQRHHRQEPELRRDIPHRRRRREVRHNRRLDELPRRPPARPAALTARNAAVRNPHTRQRLRNRRLARHERRDEVPCNLQHRQPRQLASGDIRASVQQHHHQRHRQHQDLHRRRARRQRRRLERLAQLRPRRPLHPADTAAVRALDRNRNPRRRNRHRERLHRQQRHEVSHHIQQQRQAQLDCRIRQPHERQHHHKRRGQQQDILCRRARGQRRRLEQLDELRCRRPLHPAVNLRAVESDRNPRRRLSRHRLGRRNQRHRLRRARESVRQHDLDRCREQHNDDFTPLHHHRDDRLCSRPRPRRQRTRRLDRTIPLAL